MLIFTAVILNVRLQYNNIWRFINEDKINWYMDYHNFVLFELYIEIIGLSFCVTNGINHYAASYNSGDVKCFKEAQKHKKIRLQLSN